MNLTRSQHGVIDMEPERRESWRGGSLGWDLRLTLCLLIMAVGFVMYFGVPRVELYWNNQGVPLPGWAMLLISVSHLMHKYFYILLIGLVGLIWLSRSPSSGRRE